MQIDANGLVFYMQISHANPLDLLFFRVMMLLHHHLFGCVEKNALLQEALLSVTVTFGFILCILQK